MRYKVISITTNSKIVRQRDTYTSGKEGGVLVKYPDFTNMRNYPQDSAYESGVQTAIRFSLEQKQQRWIVRTLMGAFLNKADAGQVRDITTYYGVVDLLSVTDIARYYLSKWNENGDGRRGAGNTAKRKSEFALFIARGIRCVVGKETVECHPFSDAAAHQLIVIGTLFHKDEDVARNVMQGLLQIATIDPMLLLSPNILPNFINMMIKIGQATVIKFRVREISNAFRCLLSVPEGVKWFTTPEHDFQVNALIDLLIKFAEDFPSDWIILSSVARTMAGISEIESGLTRLKTARVVRCLVDLEFFKNGARNEQGVPSVQAKWVLAKIATDSIKPCRKESLPLESMLVLLRWFEHIKDDKKAVTQMSLYMGYAGYTGVTGRGMRSHRHATQCEIEEEIETDIEAKIEAEIGDKVSDIREKISREIIGKSLCRNEEIREIRRAQSMFKQERALSDEDWAAQHFEKEVLYKSILRNGLLTEKAVTWTQFQENRWFKRQMEGILEILDEGAMFLNACLAHMDGDQSNATLLAILSYLEDDADTSDKDLLSNTFEKKKSDLMLGGGHSGHSGHSEHSEHYADLENVTILPQDDRGFKRQIEEILSILSDAIVFIRACKANMLGIKSEKTLTKIMTYLADDTDESSRNLLGTK